MTPTTSASNSGVGESSYLIEGSSVIGFFRDGDSCQDGLVIGSVNGIPAESRRLDKGFNDHRTDLSPSKVPGVPQSASYQDGVGVSLSESTRLPYPNSIDEPDTSKLARNENTSKHNIIKNKKASQATQTGIPTANGGSFSEPAVPYASKYPYNKVIETESGHIIELDDTPSNERVHIAHRSGSFMEMHKDGDVVNKSAKDEYNITQGSQFEHVEGVKHLTIDKGAKIYVNKDNGSEGLEIQIGSGGNINIVVTSGNVNLTVNGDMKQDVSGDMVVSVGGRYKLTASQIDLN
jgi:hypothetical protein